MAFTYDGVYYPGPDDQHDWHTDMRLLAQSTRGIPPVSSAAARDAMATAAANAGMAASPTNPVYVYRADTGAIEVTTNGSTWAKVDLGDTGWVALTRAAGFSAGNISYRKKSGVVYLFFDVTVSTATSAALVATMPTSARPQFNYSGVADGGVTGALPRLIVNSGGDVTLLWIGDGTGVRFRGSATYPAGT